MEPTRATRRGDAQQHSVAEPTVPVAYTSLVKSYRHRRHALRPRVALAKDHGILSVGRAYEDAARFAGGGYTLASLVTRLGLVKDITRNKFLYLLALPGLLLVVIFSYVPMLGHLIAFEKYDLRKGILKSPWVGFDNFKFFFTSNSWIHVTMNTILLNGLFITFGIGTAILLALFINEIRFRILKRISQSFIFLPYFVSWLVVSIMTFTIFGTSEGLLNRLLSLFGVSEIRWYQIPEVWPGILTAVYVWKFSGYYSIIVIAAITGVSAEYYESARIDGATRLQQILYITLPMIRLVVIVLVLLGLGRIFFGDFGMIYGIIGDNGLLFATTDVIDTYSYRALRQLGNFSMSSSIILYQSTMGLLTILLFNWIVKRIDPDLHLF